MARSKIDFIPYCQPPVTSPDRTTLGKINYDQIVTIDGHEGLWKYNSCSWIFDAGPMMVRLDIGKEQRFPSDHPCSVRNVRIEDLGPAS